MANLTPNPAWDDVFQLETTTLALGGAGGPMNSQAQALLNRTALLAQGRIIVGSTAPGSGVGLDGQFYLNASTLELYGPKTAGAWGSAVAQILDAASIGVTIQPYDAGTLTSSDIGVTVQGYDASILKSADIGVTVQGYDSTLLKSADIGVSVQAYDPNTAKTDEGNLYEASQSGTLGTVDDPDAPITDDGTDLVIDLSKRQFFFFEFPDGDPRNLAAPLNVPSGITSGSIWFKQSSGGGSVLTAGAAWIPLNGVMPDIAVGADEVSRLDFIVNPDGDIEFNLSGPWEAGA